MLPIGTVPGLALAVLSMSARFFSPVSLLATIIIGESATMPKVVKSATGSYLAALMILGVTSTAPAWANIRVWPSVAALTKFMAIMPPAPGRLSIRTG